MKTALAALLAGAVVAAAPALAIAGEANQPAAKSQKTYVVVFDFLCKDKPELGRQLADSIRQKLGAHQGCEVIDLLTTREASGPLGADADKTKITALMRDKLAVNLALYGTVSAAGGGFRADVACIDLRKGAKEPSWSKTFSDDTERARGLIAAQVVEAVRSASEWRPPEYGDEPEPKGFGKSLNANGDFEGAGGWDRPDNAGTFIEAGDKERGKVLRIQTDLEREKWLEYQRQLRFGQTDPSKAPKLESDTGYYSVAGMEGVHYRGTAIPATPGQRYWLVADMKGKTTDFFFPKIFVKGYEDWSRRADGLPEASMVERKLTADAFAAMPADKRKELIEKDAKDHPERYRRECFRWYLSCRNELDQWKHYAAAFPPRGGLPAKVQWLQIEIYAYWPPGKFLFDKVFMYADPGQKAPLPEEAPRTPNFGKTSDVVEKATSRKAN
jgi:TolB-like protein